jgi:hypothetical protein
MAASEPTSSESEDEEQLTDFNVVVDFAAGLSRATIAEEFSDAIHVEGIGPQKFQIGYGVSAPSMVEAYRQVANMIEDELGDLGTEPAFEEAHVYGEGTKKVFGRRQPPESDVSFDVDE